MSPVIGWYAHHVGAGHVARARLVADLMHTPVVILSSAPKPVDWPAHRWVSLASDEDAGGRDHSAGGVLHWAPLGHSGYSERMAQVAAWLGVAQPSLLVSDVSVEVTILARAMGTPVATMVMAGDRRDRPHQTGYDAATWLFAAWPGDVHPVLGWRSRWNSKTAHLGAFSRFDSRTPSPAPGERRLAVLWGRGGVGLSERQIVDAARATPDWSWQVCRDDDPGVVWSTLQSSDVVVCHGGQNIAAEVAAARRPAVVIPEPRPHDEQQHLVAALQRLGLTQRLTAWPTVDEWPLVLRTAAEQIPENWSRWSDGQGGRRFATLLDQLAEPGAA